MKQWCKYCQTVTQPAPAHPGRPRGCAICRRPFDSAPAPAPPGPADPRGQQAQSPAVGSPPRPPPAGPPGPHIACFHLRDRNNQGTSSPMPHTRNACYARLHVRPRWGSPTAVLVPATIPPARQACYCFADYPSCPFFLPLGTPPQLLREANESPAAASPALRPRR